MCFKRKSSSRYPRVSFILCHFFLITRQLTTNTTLITIDNYTTAKSNHLTNYNMSADYSHLLALMLAGGQKSKAPKKAKKTYAK